MIKEILYLQGGLALILQVLILQGLIRTGGKRYFLLTLYIVSLFLGTVAVLSARLGGAEWSWTSAATRYYWSFEILQQVLVFSTIIGLTYQHLSESASRARMARWLFPGAATVLGVILWVHHDPDMTRWMTPASRDLSFVATILNLMLWSVLLREKDRNPRLLLVSGGLGIQLAGAALGQGIRLLWEFSRVFVTVGNYVVSITYLVSLFVLYRAFARPENPAVTAARAKQA